MIDNVGDGKPVALKPCPFCGGEAETLAAIEMPNHCRCVNKNCPGNDVSPTLAGWNRRPAPTDEEIRLIRERARKEWAGDKPVSDAEMRLLNWAVGFAIREAVLGGRE